MERETRSEFRQRIKDLDHTSVITEMRKWMNNPRQYRFYTKEDPEYIEGFGGNYNSPLWEFQELFLEHTQPHPTSPLYAVVMHLGDIFRGLCGNYRMNYYPIDKMREARRDVTFIEMELLVQKLPIDQKLKDYREKNDLLIEYTQKFPRDKLMPNTTIRKTVQLASLNTIKLLTNWTLKINTTWDSETLIAYRRMVVELIWRFADKYKPILNQQLKMEQER